MPVYLLTFHAYRSWSEDNPRGFVEKNKPGVRPAHRALADARRKLAKHPPRRFNPNDQVVILVAARDIAGRRDWRLHAISATPTHVHVLVSWASDESSKEVATTLKRLLGMLISNTGGTSGGRWFSAGGDRKPVKDREHLDFLVSEYLPKHVNEGGKVWVEPEGAG